MKKIIFLTLLVCSLFFNAQGRRDGQSSIHAQYGYIFPKNDQNAGYVVKIGYDRVFGNKGFIGKAEAFYQKYEVDFLNNQILPYSKYGVNVNAGYSLEFLYPFMINAYVGGFGGYESANNGSNKDPKDGSEMNIEMKGFTYGLSGSLEGEVFLTRRISFLVDYSQFYDLKSQFSKSSYAISGGFKYIIN